MINAVSSYLNVRAQRESGFDPTGLVADLDLQTYLSHDSRTTAETIQAHAELKMHARRVSDRACLSLHISEQPLDCLLCGFRKANI